MWRFVRIHGGTVFCGARKLFYLFILQVFLNATKTASIVAHYSGIVPRPPVACPKMVYRGIKVNFKDGVKHFTGSNIVLFTLLSSLYFAVSQRKTTTLPSVHEAEITTLDWDARGMMLFSADVAGHVYASHLDMQSVRNTHACVVCYLVVYPCLCCLLSCCIPMLVLFAILLYTHACVVCYLVVCYLVVCYLVVCYLVV